MKRQRVNLFEAYAYCCRICPLEFFIGLKIKNNIKFQCANARIRSGVRLERRVAASLVSQRQKQDNEAENALHSTQQKFGVFSSQANGTLQNIATKDLATPEIEQSFVQARSLGQT